MIAAETGNTETTESQLLRLIQHCEQYPGKLATHALRCRTALLGHYDEADSEEKMNEALDQAQQAFGGPCTQTSRRQGPFSKPVST